MSNLDVGTVPPRARTRTEHAAIFVGRLAEQGSDGDRLGTKEELRERSGVSKGTFNEALRLLQTRGLISVRPGPGGGIFVARPAPLARLGSSFLALDQAGSDVADAIAVRDELEHIVVREAVRYAQSADVHRMREALDEMTDAVDRRDMTAFVRANWDLHAAIARTTPNTILRSIYLGLLELVSSHTRGVVGHPDQPLDEYVRSRLRLHVDLVEAIARQDADEAARLIDEHTFPTA